MLDIKSMSAEEVLNLKDSYVERLDQLDKMIEAYLTERDPKSGEKIKEEYTKLKKEITQEAKNLKREKNELLAISQEHNGYVSGIMEASACGFKAKSDSPINLNMLFSVKEARYRINKFFE